MLLKKGPLNFSSFLCPFSVPGSQPGHCTTCGALSPYALLGCVALRLALLLTTLMVLKGAGWQGQRMPLNFDVSDVFVVIVLGLQVWGKKTTVIGALLVVQWLSLHLPMPGVQVQSLAGDLKSHMPLDRKNKTQHRNIITNSIKT